MTAYSFDLPFLLLVGLAIGFDLKERRIPNWLVGAGIVAGVLLGAFRGGGTGLLGSLGGLLLGIGLFLPPVALGLVGAGDAKLAGALGAILGAALLPRMLFYSALAGGLLALISIARRGLNLQVFRVVWEETRLVVLSRGKVAPADIGAKHDRGAGTIPLGVAIGIGALLAVYADPRGEWAGF